MIVENDQIIDTWTNLIRPPRRDFVFTYLHGIGWEHVKNKPTFAELWGDIAANYREWTLWRRTTLPLIGPC